MEFVLQLDWLVSEEGKMIKGFNPRSGTGSDLPPLSSLLIGTYSAIHYPSHFTRSYETTVSVQQAAAQFPFAFSSPQTCA
jgi:hypothetical protein